MSLTKRSDIFFWAAFGILGLLALGLNLGITPLHFEEPRRAIVALEMQLSGNWWVPTINDHFYYNKPPVYNWFLILLFKLFGYSEWVVRLPSVLSLIAIGAIMYRYYKEKLGHKTAQYAALFWLTTADLLFYFSFQGEIDLFYSLIVIIQILVIFHYFEKKQWLALFVISYIFCGIGFLTKGLPSLAFQGLTLLGLFSARRQFWKLLSWQHITGLVLILLIIGGYFWKYSQFNDPAPYILRLLSESTRRTAVGENSIWDTISHLFTFPLMLGKLLLPWFIFIPVAWFGYRHKSFYHKRDLWYAGLFILVNIPLYWLSAGTRERYLYMFLPFCFIILAFFIVEAQREKLIRKITLILTGILILASSSIPFVNALQFIENRYVMSMSFIAFAALIGWFTHYRKIDGIRLLVLLLFGARILFNLTVLPARAEKALEEDYKGQMNRVLRITENQPVDLVAAEWSQAYAIPLTGDSLTYQEMAWPPYQVSFYLSRANRSILKQKGQEAPWILREVTPERVKDVPDSMIVSIPGKQQFYLLEAR